MKELLKKHGYRVTPARLAVLDIFSKCKKPLNAEAVYKSFLKIKKLENINEATVYRTLFSLEEGGILKKVEMRKNSTYFELNGVHHHHMVCTRCNRIEDFENSELESILGRIVENSSKFKKIKEHSVELFGFCKLCA